MKENEKQQEEWRAEAAAQRMVVEGDEELRKVGGGPVLPQCVGWWGLHGVTAATRRAQTIQNEERTKMEKEKEQYLEVALEEERCVGQAVMVPAFLSAQCSTPR